MISFLYVARNIEEFFPPYFHTDFIYLFIYYYFPSVNMTNFA
jgi:hypothetical protein